MFFSFDGVDGVGKTTQIERFVAWLRAEGHAVTCCRDPGSTALGEKLRQIVLDDRETAICRRSEMLIYMAARAQLVEEIILPALGRHEIVVADRFLLANVVYQGYGGGLDVESLWQVGRVATADVMPDLTFLLDMPVEAAMRRLSRSLDRMEEQGAEFRARLRQGFLAEAARRPRQIAVVDADRPPDEIEREIRSLVAERLGESPP